MKEETIKKAQEHKHEDFSYAINETGEYRNTWRIFRIMAEFVEGYQFLSKFNNAVTILGSARTKEGEKYYEIAQELGGLLAKEGYQVVTGGGPGIMEAANRGAKDGGGESIGLNIQLPFEQRINPYVTKSTAFYYFFTRKVMLTSPAKAFILFPGGFGTLDEFFEIVDMIELGKMGKVPVILVGSDYWGPLLSFLHDKPVHEGFIPEVDIDSWFVVDSADEVMEKMKENGTSVSLCELAPQSFQCSENVDWKIFRIMAELVEGFEFLTGLVEDVTVLGTKSIKPTSHYYDSAYKLGSLFAQDKLAVVTGGALGIAEAANKGAMESGGQSIGIGMKVGDKSRINDYLTKSIIFHFPFTRKVIVTAPSKGFVFYPGALGTLHQLFEVLTLIQTKKMQKVPIMLYDSEYWQGLCSFGEGILVDKFKTISPEDFKLCHITDDEEEIVKTIRSFREQ